MDCSENFRVVCIWPLPTGQQYQHTPPYSKLWQQKKMSSYILQMSLGVKINLHREPLIETFCHTEANWTLRLDKYIINFFAGWQGAHWWIMIFMRKFGYNLRFFMRGNPLVIEPLCPRCKSLGSDPIAGAPLWLHTSSFRERPEALASLYLPSEQDRTDCFSNTS